MQMNTESNKYNRELLKDLLFHYSSIGDLKNLKILIEAKQLDVNSTKHSLTPLSVCAAKSGDIQVIEYLLSKGSEIRDSHLHAVKAGNVEALQLLLSKLSKNREISPIRDSALFAPYMTPLMLAAICGHQTIVELLMFRGHTIPIPHMANCECDDCNVSSTHVSTPSQRNLDIYRALCNPAYIGVNSLDPINKSFELESEARLVIENSSYFSHHYTEMFRKMENYIIDIMNVTRDAEEVNVLVQQKGVKPRPNAFIKYLVLQNAIDHNWVDFIASKRIESLRSHLWLGHNKVWFHSGMEGLLTKFSISWLIMLTQFFTSVSLVVGYRKHITAQSRYLCRLFNESLFALVLLHFLTINSTTGSERSHLTVNIFLICWALGNVVNLTKKSAIFGLKKLGRFYGHVFELIITFELIFILFLTFTCEKSNKTSEPNNHSIQNSDVSMCTELKYVLLRILIKLLYARLVLLSSLRAYKGSKERTVIRLFLLSYCVVSVLYPLFSNTLYYHYNLSTLDATLGVNMFGDIDPLFIFIATNFLIGLTFEIITGPEKISDKFWCFHWTARLVYEIHGACELAIPFNIIETHRVLYILLKRVGFKEKVNEKDIQQYERIKALVYSRYECIKYLDSKTSNVGQQFECKQNN